jgi:OmpA-OmpF porin, OOP family
MTCFANHINNIDTTMKKIAFLLACVPMFWSCSPFMGGAGGGSPTGGTSHPPNVPREEITSDIRSNNVRVVNNLTEVSLTFINTTRQINSVSGQQKDGAISIGLDPNVVLTDANGRGQYRFVRAEGVPMNPRSVKVNPGQRIDFKVYFEAIPPSIDAVNFIECNDDDRCWNLYNLPVNGTIPGNRSGGYPTNPQQRIPQPQQTPSQTNNRVSDYVKVLSVNLTDQYTIIDFRVKNINPQNKQSSFTVGFHADAMLIAMNGERRFNFVRAEKIPIHPKSTPLQPGQSLDFRVYFDRLDRGIEEFDLFECHDGDTYQCWNLYDIRVNNPAMRTPVPTRTPSPVPEAPSTPSDSPRPPVDPRNPQPQKLPEQEAPKPVPAPVVLKGIVLTGTVKNSKTGKPVSARVGFIQSPNRSEMDSVQSFQESGLYKIKLETGQVYSFVASARGYLVTTESIDLSKVADGQTIRKDIVMKPFAVGDKITLNNIYFEMGKADLLDASFAELDKLAQLMEDNPTMRIRLEGHTDIIGDPDANQELSENRVVNVKKYLADHGTNPNRVEAVGYGSKYPKVTKGTDEERRVNRRVEFVILSM